MPFLLSRRKLFRLVSLAALGIAFLAILPTGGCATMNRIINRAEKPSARVTGGSLRSLSLDGAEIALEVEVANPYDVPLPIAAVDFALLSQASTLVTGRLEEPAIIEPRAAHTLTIPIGVTFADALRILSSVRPGAVVPYEAQATVKVDAPRLGALSFPLAQRGELPIPAVPDVSIESVRFEELSLSNAAAEVRIAIGNPNSFDATFSDFGYALEMGGVEVGRGALAESRTLKKNGRGTLIIPLRFSPREFGVALFQTLMSGEASYRLHGGVELDTRFGALHAPFERSGSTSLVR